MSRAKLTVPLCFVILGAVASIPTSASGATAGWMVNGSLLTTTAAIATAGVDQEYRLSIPSAEIEIGCSGSNIDNVNAHLTPPNKLFADEVVLTGCATANEAVCRITKTIGTAPTISEVTLDGALAAKAIIKPATKTTFATIKLEGETCALIGVFPVAGQGSALGPTNQDERTVQQYSSTTRAASGELKVGSSAAEVTGIGLGHLVSGLAWSFL